MTYDVNNILDYLTSRNWKVLSKGKIFTSLKPDESLKLPDNFVIDIPLNNDIAGNQAYLDRFVNDYVSLFGDVQEDELKILFSEKSSFIKYRIFDTDNEDGTININKFVNSIDAFKHVLESAVSFTVNKKLIFGNSQSEASEYFRNCRVMQSVKGSYVNRFEVKNRPLFTTFDEVTTQEVNKKLFEVLDFINEDVLVNVNRPVTEEYISDNKDLINYDLIKSVKNVYAKSFISNIEYTLESSDCIKTVVTKKMSSKIKFFNSYLSSLKHILEEVTVFETQGYVTNLNSNDPVKSDKNEVMLNAKKVGLKKPVKFYLRSEEYIAALDAHKNHQLIKIRGKVKEFKTFLLVQDLEYFDIL